MFKLKPALPRTDNLKKYTKVIKFDGVHQLSFPIYPTNA